MILKLEIVIIIPNSFNSDDVSFGVIESEQWASPYYNNSKDNSLLKRPVRWIKEVRRREVRPLFISNVHGSSSC